MDIIVSPVSRYPPSLPCPDHYCSPIYLLLTQGSLLTSSPLCLWGNHTAPCPLTPLPVVSLRMTTVLATLQGCDKTLWQKQFKGERAAFGFQYQEVKSIIVGNMTAGKEGMYGSRSQNLAGHIASMLKRRG